MTTLVKTRSTPREVDTIIIHSAELGVRIARSAKNSATSNAEYSKAVVQDGKSSSAYIIEKRTGRISGGTKK